MEIVVNLAIGLAWPITIIWLAYLLRPEVRTLIDRIVSLKVPGAEAKFDKSLKEAEVEAAKMPPILPASPDKSDEVMSKLDQLRRIAAVSPRAAIMEAWVLIETAALSSDYFSDTDRRPTSIALLHHIVTTGKLSQNSANLIISLRNLRNQAAHLPDFALTQEEAERYLELAVTVSKLIENAKAA